MHTIKKYIKKDIADLEGIITEKGGISSATLERIHMLTDTYKNICKIEKYDTSISEEPHAHMTRKYSSDEVKELMEKVYDQIEYATDKAAILKAMKDI